MITRRRKVELAAQLRALKRQGKRICGERDDFACRVEFLESDLAHAEAEIGRLNDRNDSLHEALKACAKERFHLREQLGRSQ